MKKLFALLLLTLLFAGCSDYEQMLEDDYGCLRRESARVPEITQSSASVGLTSVVAGTAGCTWLWDGSIGDVKAHSMLDDGRGVSGDWYYFSDVAEGGSSKTYWLNDDFVAMISQYHMISGSVVLGTEASLTPYVKVGFNLVDDYDAGANVNGLFSGVCVAYALEGNAPTMLEAVPSNAPTVTKYDNPSVTLDVTGGSMAVMKYPWSMFVQGGWGRRTDITTVLAQLGHLELRFMGKRGTSSKISVYAIGFLN